MTKPFKDPGLSNQGADASNLPDDRSPENSKIQASDQEALNEIDEVKQQLEDLKQELRRKDLRLQSLARTVRDWEQREKQLMQMEDAYRKAIAISQTGSYRLVRALSAPLRIAKRGFPPNFGNSVEAFPQRLKSLLRAQQQELSGGAAGLAEFVLTDQDALQYNWKGQLDSVRDLFDAEWYLRENEDVAASGMTPLEHYLRKGSIEGRAPNPLFDPKFYLKNYPESAITGQNPLQHYLAEGWKKGFKPNPKFDPSFYRSTYPDIAEAGVEPLTHFITTGLREGRATCLEEDLDLELFESEVEIPREPLPTPAPFESDVKAIALFLPQFHPIPENDEWWGMGFTEWTNVRKGTAQFKDHYQPHVPHSSHYYDLRDAAELERQIRLAQDYGIYGFCFYYYWFAGKILLDLPIRHMMKRGQPDFPFCICWANENWTRRWDGRDRDVLVAQKHSPEDDLAFIKNLEPFLLHRNYIRVEGKPLLIVYQPKLLPDAKATAERWREYFRAQGHGEIYLAAMQTFSDRKAASEYGFDAVIQFPPHMVSPPINSLVEGLDKSFEGQVYDYNRTKHSFISELRERSAFESIYPGVMPSWDNTARRKTKSSVWINASPESYYDWLWQVTNLLRKSRPYEEKFVFINAWNEWAEGCHLEPDEFYGYAWLNATRRALELENSEVAVHSYHS